MIKAALPRSRFPADCASVARLRIEIAQPVTFQLHVQTLATETEHVRGRCAVVAGQFEGRLDAQALDQIGGLAHEFS